MSQLEVTVPKFGTTPGIIHGHGFHGHKPFWQPIRQAYLLTPHRPVEMPPDLTILTCNNGHPSLGCFEESLSRMGLGCHVCGQGINPWINGRHKPAALTSALRHIQTEYTLYADSRDAFLIHPPARILERYKTGFSCELLFGGDRLSYPPDAACKSYEDNQPGADATEFKYLNAGAWIGRTQFAMAFFQRATQTAPLPAAPHSEQGVLRQLLPEFGNRIGIDHRCDLFLNIGFIFDPNALVLKQLGRLSPEITAESSP